VQIILADTRMNKQLYSLTVKFHKVVQQQIWGEVVEFTLSPSAAYLRMQKWEIY